MQTKWISIPQLLLGIFLLMGCSAYRPDNFRPEPTATISQQPPPTATRMPPMQTPAAATASPTLTVTPTVTRTPQQPTATLKDEDYEVIGASNFERLKKVGGWTWVPDFMDNIHILWPETYKLAFNSHGTQLVYPTEQELIVADITGLRPVHTFPTGDHYSKNTILSRDYQYLALTNTSDGLIEIINLVTGNVDKVMTNLPPNTSPRSGDFSQDNRYLAISHCPVPSFSISNGCISSTVLIYDLEQQDLILELKGRQAIVESLHFLPGADRLLMTGRGENLRKADVLIWDLKGNTWLFEAELDKYGPVRSIVNDAGTLAILYTEFTGQTTLLDLTTYQIKQGVAVDQIRCSKFLPGSDFYVVVQAERLLLADGDQQIGAIEQKGLYFEDVFISPDGKFIYLHEVRGIIKQLGVTEAGSTTEPGG